MTAPEPGQTAIGAMLKALDAKEWGPRVNFATVRVAEADGGPELHIECRFADGQKYAPISVTDGEDGLADWIVASFRLRNALPALAAYCEAAEAFVSGYAERVDEQFYVAYMAARAALAAALKGGE